jgi:glycosyltransferase involved in cell wall biosynthesis
MKISVVMPSYNAAKYIQEAINSVITQTEEDWELIIVDNNSTDGTRQIIEAYTDPRITMETVDNQGVIGLSRNVGISKAKGEFLAFLDADDAWFPDKLKIAIETHEMGYDLVCHGEKWVWQNGRVKSANYGRHRKLDYEDLLLRGNCLSTSAVSAKTSVLLATHGFSEKVEMVTVEDYDLWLRIALGGYSIKTIDNYLGIYRVHEGNSISQPDVYLRSMVVLLKTHFTLPQNSYIEQRIRYRRDSDLYAEVASMEFSSARFVPGLRHTVHAFRLSSRPRKEMLLPVAGVMNLMNSFLFGIVMRIRRKRHKNRRS